MRIISGAFKGRKIIAPANLPVRPTTDFAKEALFNVLNHHYYFDEIAVLDLFAGIGSVGLEFASRGSKKIVSVDSEIGCVKFISSVVDKLEIGNQMTVVRDDVFKFLSKNNQGSFDIIFADPFYEMEMNEFLEMIQLIRGNNWLKQGGELILEHSKNIVFDESNAGWKQSRRYGNVNFSFFKFDNI